MSTHRFHRSSRALVTLLVAIGLQLTLSPILRAASPAHEALDQFFASQSQEDLPDLLSDPVAIVLPSGNRLTEVADLPTQVEGWSYRSVLPCLLADLDLASGEAIPIQLRGSPEALASQGGYSGGCLSEAPGGGVARAAVLSFTTDRAGGVGRLDAWPADRSEPRLGDTVVRFHPREASENTTILNLCAPSGSGDCARGDLFLRASESTHTRVYLSGYFVEASRPRTQALFSGLGAGEAETNLACPATKAVCKSPKSIFGSACSCPTTGTCGSICGAGKTIYAKTVGGACTATSSTGSCSANQNTCPLDILCTGVCCVCEL